MRQSYQDPDRPKGKFPRIFAKVFSGLPKNMTEDEFKKLNEVPVDGKVFGEGPYDYVSLLQKGPVARLHWKWESIGLVETTL